MPTPEPVEGDMSDIAASNDDTLRWRGINHLAMVTPDMDTTVRFYHGVLGMRLVGTIAVGPMKHYFFEMGSSTTIAFFEWQGTEIGTYAKPAGIPPDFPAQFDHISFDLPDEAALVQLQTRLREHHVEVTDEVDHGFLRSVYFTDPHGVALEATYWVVDPTGRPADYADGRLFSDDDPVPAVREIMATGTAIWHGATALVDAGADPA
jgi:catechol 2,3-dioxygenase-like lactoylglutathione lyase family enzyme